MTALLALFALVAAVIIVLVVVFVAWESVPALDRIGSGVFFSTGSWYPGEGQWSLVPMIVGTLLCTVGAVAIAGPLGVLTAVCARFHAPPAVRIPLRRVLELLAGIPSVVYGFWGLVVLVPLIGAWNPPGTSLLAATLVLAVMIVPTVALIAEGSLAQVPRSLLHGAYALGLGRVAVVWRVAVPAARGGIVTGVVLGTARAVGETMAVLMVCGGVARIPSSVFDPIRTLTANIALEMAYAMGDHRSALFVSALVLIGLVVVLVGIAEWVDHTRTGFTADLRNVADG